MFKTTFLTLFFASAVGLAIANPAIAEVCEISLPVWESKLPEDTLSNLLTGAQSCPEDVTGFKKLVAQNGYSTEPFIVAKRGFHSPSQGSFSFFETVSGAGLKSGDFTFGHFSEGRSNNVLTLAQTPSRGALMIELIVWDSPRQVFNFYELIGTGTRGKWFYRGNSFDIADDTENLFTSRNAGMPAFGKKLRCSGCHISGGPILKETDHQSDWWKVDRKLPLGAWTLDADVKTLFGSAKDASEFASTVNSGQTTLENSVAFQSHRRSKSLQSQFRPLFCDEQIELGSDPFPLEGPSASVIVPVKSLVSDWLGSGTITVSKKGYLNALSALGSRFPGTQMPDGDHAWLVPIKGRADSAAIQQLVADGLLTDDFVFDVLAIDFQNPVLSEKRCALLQLLPKELTADWKIEFTQRLAVSPQQGALELLKFINDPQHNPAFHKAQAAAHLVEIQNQLNTEQGLKSVLMKNVFAKRRAVFNSELSSNPLGQIFEPGFRVIFPELP